MLKGVIIKENLLGLCGAKVDAQKESGLSQKPHSACSLMRASHENKFMKNLAFNIDQSTLHPSIRLLRRMYRVHT